MEQTKDLEASLREVQDELFRKVRDEFKKMRVNMMNEIQKVKLDMMEGFKSLQDTLNLQMKTTRSLKADCGRVRNQTVRVSVNSQLKGSAASSPKRRGARTVPSKIQHRTLHARKPEKGSRGNSSKHRSGFGSQPRKLGRIPRSSFSWWRVRVSSHALPSHVKENLFATHGKRPFDRGRARLVRRGEVKWSQSFPGLNLEDKIQFEEGCNDGVAGPVRRTSNRKGIPNQKYLV